MLLSALSLPNKNNLLMKMSMGKMNFKALLLLAVLASGLVSCSDNNDSTKGDQTAHLSVSMTDAPGDYEQVNIDVKDVMIQTAAAQGDGENWVSVGDVQAGVYNLLDLTGGVTQLLADAEVPAGYVGQIRLVLGTDNNVKLAGQDTPEPLSTPSAQQSGLKLQINQELEAGKQYSYLLDFDVDQSIVTTGNGGYILKPVIRVSAEEGAGTVVGAVHPTNFQTLVELKNASTTISAYANEQGEFALHGVPAGTYQLTVTPAPESGIPAVVQDNIVVEENASLDLGTIFME